MVDCGCWLWFGLEVRFFGLGLTFWWISGAGICLYLVVALAGCFILYGLLDLVCRLVYLFIVLQVVWRVVIWFYCLSSWFVDCICYFVGLIIDILDSCLCV